MAGFLLAELTVRSDTADGLATRLCSADRVPSCTSRDLEPILRALQREGRVHCVESTMGGALVWAPAAKSVGGSTAGFPVARTIVSPARPAHSRGHHILEQLQELTLTPAGNPRPGSVGLLVKWRDRSMDARVEVVDDLHDKRRFWLCLRITQAQVWTRLRTTAETPSPSWLLPWRAAPDIPSDLPFLLAWRSVDLEGVVDAICEAADTLRFGSLADVSVLAISPPRPSGDRRASNDDHTVTRLLRRRGVIPGGRKHPVRGTCDRCGQPLSDPYSLLIGIGPTCRQYYPPHVINAVARSAASGDRSGSYTRSPADALLHLAQAWAHSAHPASQQGR